MMPSLRVAVVGASGYSGEELVRLVSRHPKLTITALTSRAYDGKRAGRIISGLPGQTAGILFRNLTPAEVAREADVAILALPHGVASEYAVPLRAAGRTVIDLSADFRVRDAAVYQEFYHQTHPAPQLLPEAVYGLPELHRDQIKKSDLIAVPGCYPTSVVLPLAPALKAGLIDPATIVIASLSGISGAGKKAEIGLLYVELNENMHAYSVPRHRHLSEIEQELGLIAKKKVQVTFVPHLVPLSRGLQSTISATLAKRCSPEELQKIYEKFYDQEPFIDVKPAGELPEVKHVVRTNKAEIAALMDERTNRLLLFSCIDNLGKGAAGQAVQALNIRFGFDETTGLSV
jgi:N-acetyl-gamma-glutamyl-phosphate reductase